MTGPTDTPTRVGRYELVLPLSQGPLGELSAACVAEGAEQGRVVALRRIKAGRALWAESARAAHVATSLRHPKVLALLDVLESDDELSVVSELIDGESLAALMRQARSSKNPIPPGTAVAIARDATDALIATRDHFAKQADAPSPHGGLVADGLVVAAYGDTMLMEPGLLAALADVTTRPTAIPHLAPEQLGAVRARDERSDVYAVGVLLWEMLANRALFHSSASAAASAREELAKKLREEPIPSLDALPRQGAPLPSGLVLLVARATLRDPGHRFQTLDALRAAFEELPRDLIAPPEQVVVTVERLARTSLEHRRGVLRSAEEGRISLSPESTRSTARPPAPDADVAVVIPPLGASPRSRVASFGTSEAPTKPRRKLTPVAVPVPPVAEVPSPPLAEVPRPAPVPAPHAAEVDVQRLSQESTSSAVTVLESESAIELPSTSGLRRFGPLVLIALGVAAVVVALIAHTKAPDAGSAGAVISSGEPTASTPPELAQPSASAPPAPSASSEAEPEPSASSAPARPREVHEREVKHRDPGSFRPKGI